MQQRSCRQNTWDIEDDNDEDHSPWLQELSTALEAIRAYVPTYMQRNQDDPDANADDWLADPVTEEETGSPAYLRAQEALSQLVS